MELERNLGPRINWSIEIHEHVKNDRIVVGTHNNVESGKDVKIMERKHHCSAIVAPPRARRPLIRPPWLFLSGWSLH